MQHKAHKNGLTPLPQRMSQEVLQNAATAGVKPHTHSHPQTCTQRMVYKKPAMVCYGPLAKNIALGVLSGAEADSSFAV